MASLLASTCWPTRFVARWLAVFFGASLLGIVLGASLHRPTPPKAVPPARVQAFLRAEEVYSDGTRELVPARVTTGGIGERPIPESEQGATSTDAKKPLTISRVPGSKLWLIYRWQGHVAYQLINPWRQSTQLYTVDFDLKRPNPKRGAAH